MFSLLGAASTATADGPRDGPASFKDAQPLKDAHESASDAAGLIEQNWDVWLSVGLRILFIAVVAVLLRHIVRRAIDRLIQRVNRRAEAADSANALRGLIVNGERRRQRSQAIGSVLRSIASFVIIGTALLMVLSDLGLNLAPLLASAGVAGVALGFGARDVVTDVLAGIFMLLEDQYGVGDRVDTGDASGTVLEVGLRVTQLRGDAGEIWYVRNGQIKKVGNLSQGWATAEVDVRVMPSEDLDEVKAGIVAATEELEHSEPWDEQLWEPVEVLGLASVTLEEMVVRVSAKTMPGKSFGVERELRWRIKQELDRRGIVNVAQPAVTVAAETVLPRQQDDGAQASPRKASLEKASAEQTSLEKTSPEKTRREESPSAPRPAKPSLEKSAPPQTPSGPGPRT